MKLPAAIVESVATAHGIISADASPTHLRAAAIELERQAQQIREHLNASSTETRAHQLCAKLTR